MKLSQAHVRRILVLRYRSIGDILLANPALKALRRRFPESVIEMVVDDIFKDLLYQNPNIDLVIPHARKPNRAKWKVDIEMIRELRAKKYDLVVDLQGGPRGAWTTLFTGAKIRAGHHFKLRNKICYNVPAEISTPEDHTWRVQFKIVRPLGVDWPESPDFHLAIPDSKVSSAKKRLENAGLMFDRPIALIHPGARIQVKKWPAKNMGLLARWMVDEKNAAVILAGTDKDFEEIKIIRRAAEYALPYFINLDLGELAALIKSCAMVVCNDSGPMHMAGVLNTPTVSLFGPSDPVIWGPVGNKNISVLPSPPMECMPCDQRGCKYEGDHCMTRIEIEDVKRAVDRLGAI